VLPPNSKPNLLRAHFGGTSLGDAGSRIVERSGDVDAFGRSLVADLRRVQGKCPEDHAVADLVAELLASSDQFRELWLSGVVGEHQSESKVIRNTLAGDIELECDVFSVAGTDLRIVAYTAATGSETAAKLDGAVSDRADLSGRSSRAGTRR